MIIYSSSHKLAVCDCYRMPMSSRLRARSPVELVLVVGAFPETIPTLRRVRCCGLTADAEAWGLSLGHVPTLAGCADVVV